MLRGNGLVTNIVKMTHRLLDFYRYLASSKHKMQNAEDL